ncbi:exodeoxyribonuclease VII large subunit [Halieaceae bacterium IMCC14734]|uniref:Exodeoxyribonuclease 7 large subunit n=1 Tax=Candidatus Litorirhabdus singularis TaxID=2518993 RepID=A0ABT3THG7_9GAMM|nr:exodeoxyribonuclease VII large subunit [Candidatus Litorirhabdus singularis]
MNPETLSVSELNRRVKRVLDNHFDFLWVEGEISNLARPGSGHWYFSLKDDRAQVRCAMFRNTNQRVRFAPANGDQVRIRASASLYPGRGEFQLVVEHMEAAGAGRLQQAFEALKTKLQAEGLFDTELKQALPQYPAHVAIISSPTGAAIRDMITVFKRRSPGTRLTLLPVAVQGEAAAPQLAAAVGYANRYQMSDLPPFDALIIGRGGGSIEDLWAFNDETLARAINASKIPVVSAVGHEVDFTIADFVADARAATPSAAAELLSPEQPQLIASLRSTEQALYRSISRRLRAEREGVQNLRRLLKHPGERLQEQFQRLDDLELRLNLSLSNQMERRRQKLSLTRAHLGRLSPERGISQYRYALHNAMAALRSSMRLQLQTQGSRLGRTTGMLNSLSPLATLERGYALVTTEDGAVLTDASQTHVGATIHTRLAHGQLSSVVDSMSSETVNNKNE